MASITKIFHTVCNPKKINSIVDLITWFTRNAVVAEVSLLYGFNLLNGVMLKICIEICGRTTSDTCYV